MVQVKNFVITFFSLMMISCLAFAGSVDVNATVAGTDIGNTITVYSGGNEVYNINPSDPFTIKVIISNPYDSNIHLIQGWTNAVYINPTVAQTNGCTLTQEELALEYVCLDVNSEQWPLTTPAGDWNIQINRNSGTSKTFPDQFRVNSTNGFILSDSAISYFGVKDRNNIPMNASGKNYLEITNNSNSNLNIFGKANDLIGDGNYKIRAQAQKYLQFDFAEFANNFTGGDDLVISDLNVAQPSKLYMWIDFSPTLKTQAYNGTINFSSIIR